MNSSTACSDFDVCEDELGIHQRDDTRGDNDLLHASSGSIFEYPLNGRYGTLRGHQLFLVAVFDLQTYLQHISGPTPGGHWRPDMNQCISTPKRIRQV